MYIPNRQFTVVGILVLLAIGALWLAYIESVDVERRSAERTIQSVGLELFHSECMMVFQRFRPSGTPVATGDSVPVEEWNEKEVPKDEWSTTIRSLRPLNVWAEDNGLYIQILQGAVLAEGVFVASKTLGYPANPNGNGLEQIGPNLYWFKFVNG